MLGTACFFNWFLVKKSVKREISGQFSVKAPYKRTTIFPKRNGFLLYQLHLVFQMFFRQKRRAKREISDQLSGITMVCGPPSIFGVFTCTIWVFTPLVLQIRCKRCKYKGFYNIYTFYTVSAHGFPRKAGIQQAGHLGSCKQANQNVVFFYEVPGSNLGGTSSKS